MILEKKDIPLIILNYLNKIGSNHSYDEIDDIDLLKIILT